MKPLTQPYTDIVYGSDHEWSKHYVDRFRARRAVMMHAVRFGWSLEECRLVFLNETNPGSRLWLHGDDDRLLRPTEVTKRITRDYQACKAEAARSPSYRIGAEVRQELSVYAGEVKGYRWTGRSGRTDRDVLSYVIQKAIDIGCDRINVSVRDAGLGAGVTTSTARQSLKRLCDAGWLQRTMTGRVLLADEYKVLRNGTYDSLPIKDIHMCDNATLVESDHEVWLRLGKAAASIYYSLSDKPYSARRVAVFAGVNASTVVRQIPKLAEHGLARKTADGWVTGHLSPDDVVYSMGWVEDNSVAAKRRDQVEVDRIYWNWKITS